MSEAGNTTKSMVRRLILTRMNDHSGANLGGAFVINTSYGSLLSLDEKGSIIGLCSPSSLAAQHTAPARGNPSYHSQIAQSDAKLE